MGKTAASEKLAIDKKLSDQCVEYAQLKDRHVVLKDNKHAPRLVARRVVRCEDGFGCTPHLVGRAIFGTELATGDRDRYDRAEFERFATGEEVEAATQFFKEFGFAAVTKKTEGRYKLLLHARMSLKKGGVGEVRLVRNRKLEKYTLYVYVEGEDGKWMCRSTYTAWDAPDKLLLKLNKSAI